MGLRLRQLAAIAQNSLADILRAPLFALVFLAAVALAGVLPTLDYLSFLEKRRLVADSLLALAMCAASFAAAAGAVQTVGDEVRRQTATAVLSKPVGRWSFLLGKLLGLAAASGLFCLALSLSTLWASRVCFDDYLVDRAAVGLYAGAVVLGLLAAAGADFLFGKPFCSAAVIGVTAALGLGFGLLMAMPGAGGRPGLELIDLTLCPALVLVWPAAMLAAGVAMLASLRFAAAPALMVTLVVFALGLLSDYLFGRPAANSWAAAIVHRVLPNWQPFWIADALAEEVAVSWSYVARAGGYALAYLGGLWVLAGAVFERRAIG